MDKAVTDLLREWKQEATEDGISLRYPAPKDAKGFYPYGFVQKNDSTADFVGWYGFALGIKKRPSEKTEHEFNTHDDVQEQVKIGLTVFFADQKPLRRNVTAILRNKEAWLEVPFSLFPLETAKENYWEFVTGLRIDGLNENLEIIHCSVRRGNGIYIHMPVRGKAGLAEETVTYEGTVWNCSLEPLIVTVQQIFEGWESLTAQISFGTHLPESVGEQAQAVPEQTLDMPLAPGEAVPLLVSVKVHSGMVRGGHENTNIRVWGQGSRNCYQYCVELKTLCRLPHPYIYHNHEGWEKVKENITRYKPYENACQEYRDRADAWIVADPMEGKEFCYETKTESDIMSAAYLFALTGKRVYARKLSDFFRRFSDPVKGYPVRKKGCSQSYVQEGHFFKHLAIAYDVICDSGMMTKEEKAAVEGCFRLYMEMLDVHVLNGNISNWILSELQGALFCALALQDMDRALRFTFGKGGIIEQFRFGIFNDGWWHECSVGYNTWVASMMLHTAHALLPFGYNLIHTGFRVPFNQEVSSTYMGEAPVVKFGMYNQKWGGNRKPAVCIKDMFDATLPFLDYRGVLFGIADSDEKKLSGVHFGSTYDLAYYYYKDPEYLRIIAQNKVDFIFGDPDIHKSVFLDPPRSVHSGESAYADNIGIAMLRSQKEGRPQREQIQAVLRYGSHGNAHGHFDITELLSVMRYGRSFFNPENCWWGYAHFMYKFYVQCSLTKNMVTVDEKMQEPADSRRILWHSEEGLQAVGIETRARWSYPPYGGMVYEQDGQTATKEELRRRCKMNGCFLPIVEGEGSPEYGELTGFTEPVLQKRIMAVTDDYIVLFDYLEGQKEHQYDSLMQIKGFLGIEGKNVVRQRHTEQMNDNPLSDAQFITDCSWYEVKGDSVARFRTVFTEEHAGERLVCDRSNYNEPGILNMDVYTAWPRETQQMVGRVAVYEGWAADGNGYTIPLSYELKLDGVTKDAGEFDGWILGRGNVLADVRDADCAVLSLRQGVRYDEIGRQVRTPQGVFWGEICLELSDGTLFNVGKCLKEDIAPYAGWLRACISMENTDTGCGIGKDYRGGRVTIVGTEYPYALGVSPVDHGEEGRILLNLAYLKEAAGQPVVKLTACVGVDAFPGDEWQKRKTYAVRSCGRIGRYITVIEPYESESLIQRVVADSPDRVRIVRKDKTVQEIAVVGMQSASPQIIWEKG